LAEDTSISQPGGSSSFNVCGTCRSPSMAEHTIIIWFEIEHDGPVERRHCRGASRHNLQGAIAVTVLHASMEKLRPNTPSRQPPTLVHCTQVKELGVAPVIMPHVIVMSSPHSSTSPLPPAPHITSDKEDNTKE
jgi:hypothetical protein